MTISGAPNKNLVIRASAILTNGSVPSDAFIVNNAWGSIVHLAVNFTIGSLTNVILSPIVSMDDVSYYLLGEWGRIPDAADLTVTSSANFSTPFNCAGWRYFRALAVGTGDVTGSLLALTARYLQHGSQNTPAAA